jgi:hypothetical protein
MSLCGRPRSRPFISPPKGRRPRYRGLPSLRGNFRPSGYKAKTARFCLAFQRHGIAHE